MREDKYLTAMVENQIAARGIKDPRVLEALKVVPRHLFIPEKSRSEAFEDKPVPIGYGQTISQPYIVACMTAALHLTGEEKVLEVGTGCGYQTAVLSLLAKKVFTVEYREPLYLRSQKLLKSLGFTNIEFLLGDGFYGFPEKAPFEGIIVTAGAPRLPEMLLAQLCEGGRMVIPVGNPLLSQDLLLYTKTEGGFNKQNLGAVRFVPMTGNINSGK